MYIIGITGGSGAGKSIAVKTLQTLGAVALDCDAIYHELLMSDAEMITEIKSRFEGVFSGETIDRKKLGEIVWNDPQSLRDLNKITHRFIINEVNKRIDTYRAQGSKIAAIDAIALIESGQSDLCDVVIGITAPPEKRLSRIMERDDIAQEYAQKRISAQQPDSYYINNCDHILENTHGTPSEFESKCKEFFSQLIRRIDHE